MGHPARLLLAGVFALTLGARSALAVSIDDLLELQANGLPDDVLIELIAADESVFHLAADDVLRLHQQGLSDRVILAMLRTASQPTPPAEPVAGPAPVITVEQHVQQTVTDRAPEPAIVGVPVPIYIATTPVVRPRPVPPAPPVYWGWGGQRRPDSWDDGNRKPAGSKPTGGGGGGGVPR